jgi:hypothetical protein
LQRKIHSHRKIVSEQEINCDQAHVPDTAQDPGTAGATDWFPFGNTQTLIPVHSLLHPETLLK